MRLDVETQVRINAIARKLLANEPRLNSTSHFGPHVHSGLHDNGVALLFADQSEIALFGPPDETLLEYRIAALGRCGDLLVLTHARSQSFENYLKEHLNICGLTTLVAPSMAPFDTTSIPERCLNQQAVFREITHQTQLSGKLSIIPYLTTGHVWNLGREIADATSADIAICGPPPTLSRRMNDKIWFSYLAREVLGASALAPPIAVYGYAGLAAQVKRLANLSDRLVVKIPDSAGSAGNLSIDSTAFRGRSLIWCRLQLEEMIQTLGWTQKFPLKVEIWEAPVLVSPSIQVWIPDLDSGPPVIEGLFEQTVEGVRSKFVGAIRSQMPANIKDEMAHQAMILCTLFQKLGYFGRCSLDALVTGNDYVNSRLHWVECNARWGGVSLPMTLLSRLVREPEKTEILIVQRNGLQLRHRPFQVALDLLKDILFTVGKTDEGIVLLTPTGFESGRGIHFMAVGRDLDRVRTLAGEALQRLISV